MIYRRLDTWFFTKGQIIETFRGKGIYQKAIDTARSKLDGGNWVSVTSYVVAGQTDLPASQIHMFPEGRIKQEDLAVLRRFKWGVSRILMEGKGGRGGETPLIIPIWIKGGLYHARHEAPS